MFLTVLLVCFLVIVIEFAIGLASFTPVFCWLCSLCIWSIIAYVVYVFIKTIVAERNCMVMADNLLEAVYIGTKLVGTMVFLSVCMRVAIGITNLIEPVEIPQITVQQIFFPWTR